MGYEIVYCTTCQTQLRGTDFEKGAAYRVEGRPYCPKCAKETGKPLSEPPPRVTPPRPTRRPGSEIREAAPPTARYVKSTKPRRTALIAGGGIALVALLVLIAVLAGGEDNPPVAPPPNPSSPAPPAVSDEDKSARDALRMARDFMSASPNDLDGQITIFRLAETQTRGTKLHAEAKEALDALLAKKRTPGKVPPAPKPVTEDSLANDVRALIAREEFGAAVERIREERRKKPDDARLAVIKEIERENNRTVRELWKQNVEPELIRARKAGDNAAIARIKARIKKWDRPVYHGHLKRALEAEPPKTSAAPAPAPKPKPKADPYLDLWAAAMADAPARDYPALMATLKEVRKDLEDPGKCDRDIAWLGNVADFYREAAGRVEEGPVGEVDAKTLTQNATDPVAAAMFALLEGDAETARALLKGDEQKVPQRYWDYAKAVTPPAGDAAVRELFESAENRRADPMTGASAVANYRALIDEHGRTAFVRRNRAFLEDRAQGIEEYVFFPEALNAEGAFKMTESRKLEVRWMSQSDFEGEPPAGSYVEVAFAARPDAEFRCWVYAGGCCKETLDFHAQDGEAAPKEVRQRLSSTRSGHSRHDPDAEPRTWGWVEIPIETRPGARSVRILTNRKGLSIGIALVSSKREKPPRSSEIAGWRKEWVKHLEAMGRAPGKAEPKGPPVDQVAVDTAIAAGVAYLKTKAPGLERFTNNVGFTLQEDELVLWAFVHSGVPEATPEFQELLKRILDRPLETTYCVSLQAMILEELDRVSYQWRIAQCAQFLVDNQADDGGWGYGKPVPSVDTIPTPSSGKRVATPGKTGVRSLDPKSGMPLYRRVKPKVKRFVKVTPSTPVGVKRGDNSNSQYAALGLRACHEAGILLPQETLTRARSMWESAQMKREYANGKDDIDGWGYRVDSVDTDYAYGSMTAGAVGSLAIYDHLLNRDFRTDDAVQTGLEWMARQFAVDRNPQQKFNMHQFYWLYALERAGMLCDRERLGEHWWYAAGVEYLLKGQKGDGSWGNKPVRETAYALLFLRRATRRLPVATQSSRR